MSESSAAKDLRTLQFVTQWIRLPFLKPRITMKRGVLALVTWLLDAGRPCQLRIQAPANVSEKNRDGIEAADCGQCMLYEISGLVWAQ